MAALPKLCPHKCRASSCSPHLHNAFRCALRSSFSQVVKGCLVQTVNLGLWHEPGVSLPKGMAFHNNVLDLAQTEVVCYQHSLPFPLFAAAGVPQQAQNGRVCFQNANELCLQYNTVTCENLVCKPVVQTSRFGSMKVVAQCHWWHWAHGLLYLIA